LEKTMSRNRRWLVFGATAFLAAAVFTLVGCAAEGPLRPADVEQKIGAARTRADHQEIAAEYEKQADWARDAAERHRGLARTYGAWLSNTPHGGAAIGAQGAARDVFAQSRAQKANQDLIEYCQNLARIYDQAAEQNLALARVHRQLAAETKD
jgi:hypothetical protein